MKYYRSTIICFCLLIVSESSFANAIKRNLEHTFAAAVVLTDSDAFTFGISDFNPNNIIDLGFDDIGNDESIELRQKMGVVSLPLSHEWQGEGENYHQIDLKFSLLRVEQDIDFSTDELELDLDELTESVYGAYSGYRYHKQLNDQWYLRVGAGVHLLYYENSYYYNSEATRGFSNELNSYMYNTNAWAMLFEPTFKIGYKKNKEWGNWQFTSRLNYFIGRGWGEANQGDVGTPENTRWINGMEVYYDITEWGGMVQSLFSGIKRVDLAGDSTYPLGTSYYYEVTGGWLITPPFSSSVIDNIGIGVNLNYGSALRGGSIVIYFNQD